MSKSKKMIFYYSLYGRGKEEGLLKKTDSHKFSEGIIISKIENSEFIKEFLERGHIEYIEIPVLIPERILRYKLNKENK